MKTRRLTNGLSYSMFQVLELIKHYSQSGQVNKTKISKEIGATYSHTSKLARVLLDSELLSEVKIGRETFIELTPKGLIVLKYYERLVDAINN